MAGETESQSRSASSIWRNGMMARRIALALGLALSASCLASTSLASSASAAAPAPCTMATQGGEWPSYGHDPANTRTQPLETGFGPSAVTGLTPKWAFSSSSTGDGTGFNTTPVVYDGCVFIGSAGGYAYALDAKTGHVVWQHKVIAPNPGGGGAIVGAAAIDGAAVVYLVDEYTAPSRLRTTAPPERRSGRAHRSHRPSAVRLPRAGPTRTPARSSPTATSSPAIRNPRATPPRPAGSR